MKKKPNEIIEFSEPCQGCLKKGKELFQSNVRTYCASGWENKVFNLCEKCIELEKATKIQIEVKAA